jgi:putative transposase
MTDVGRISVQDWWARCWPTSTPRCCTRPWAGCLGADGGRGSQAAGAAYGQRNPERAARRNGYRQRAWDTRGFDRVRHPKAALGAGCPSFLEPRRRSEQALVAVVQEAYVNGVSTPKVDRLVEALGWPACPTMPSRGCAAAGRAGAGLRERPLEATYPYRWLDARPVKVRAGGRVEHRALVVACGSTPAASGRPSAWMWARPRPRGVLVGVPPLAGPRRGWPVGSWSSPTPTRASSKRSPQVLSAMAALHFLCDALGHCPGTSSSWSGRPSAPSSGPPTLRRPRRLLGETVTHLELEGAQGGPLLLEAKPDLLAFYASPRPTGPSCGPPTRWSGSTVRSAGAPSSASSPTMLRCCGWPAAC